VAVKILRAVFTLALAAALFWALDNRHGLFPPVGKLFNPFAGFWRNGDRRDVPRETIRIPGLQKVVEVVWDERHVPHIFAKNDHDLYCAQGYVMARDRLWQMEFQALYSAGRLSEVVGSAMIQQDRLQRRLGLTWSAEKIVQLLEADPLTADLIQAYADGVNAHIKNLSPSKLPVEYKILDYAPQPWTKLKSALLIKYMAWMLTGESKEKLMNATREVLGEEFIRTLYPDFPPYLEPVIPRGTTWDFQPLASGPTPRGQPRGSGRPEDPDRPSSAGLAASAGPELRIDPWMECPAGLGSNNWAVSGTLTRSGFPLLSNDPHLELTLPSIWYEIQLSAPGVEAYGVTCAGAPGIIIGFNRRAAWGVTAALSDVLDWYKIHFKDERRQEYFYNGAWRPVVFRTEKIKVRGGPTIIDRVPYTHLGPVVYLDGEKPPLRGIPTGAAMRWTAHEASNEFLSLYRLNRAGRYEDFLEALRIWGCPDLNFVYADTRGDIALWHTGRYPLRWKGQGRFLLDGADPADEWRGWVPWEHTPHVKNPSRGFVSSANQHPVDETYPYYLGWDYLSFERGARINELLSSKRNVTPGDMIRMQSDTLNLRARLLLPRLLSILQSAPLTPLERNCLQILAKWDFEYRPGSAAPLIFDSLWNALNEKTWNDEKKAGLELVYWPLSNVFLELALKRPDSPFFDDKTTPKNETFPDIALTAFDETCRNLQGKYGPLGDAWQWGRARGTNILHLGRIPGFGREGLVTGGGSVTINACQKNWGPSWRMVVALEPEVKAWGIYPGGQSGNPGSRHYDRAVDDWVAGRSYELVFMRSPDEALAGRTSRAELRGEK
jgi:penicillin amidase